MRSWWFLALLMTLSACDPFAERRAEAERAAESAAREAERRAAEVAAEAENRALAAQAEAARLHAQEEARLRTEEEQATAPALAGQAPTGVLQLDELEDTTRRRNGRRVEEPGGDDPLAGLEGL
ncbi:MAG: hypothetical protein AAGF12_42650 [Myxococcota bacterium]